VVRLNGNVANRILLSLPTASLRRLEPLLDLRAMSKGEVIDRVDREIEYLYFLNCGLISLVKTMQDGRSIAIGAIGIEGVSNAQSTVGMNIAILDATVQIPGSAFRISRVNLMRAMAEDSALRLAVEKYMHFSAAAFAQTAICNSLHHLEKRCCRWLLTAHDSARSDTFSLTHDMLATMLGVQRAGVSLTAKTLQKLGHVQYKHGRITITNRAGLEHTACECYGAMQSVYAGLHALGKSSGCGAPAIAAAHQRDARHSRTRLTRALAGTNPSP
jgi:CRP-like cAMP-binding protein